MQTTQEYGDLAKQAGFDNAVQFASVATQVAVASEHYAWVTTKQLEAFNAKLQRATERIDNGYRLRDELKLESLRKYAGAPPRVVLEKVIEAKSRGCFNAFQVASVVTVSERVDPDPIVFGQIYGSDRHFIIAVWGDDLKPEDITG